MSSRFPPLRPQAALRPDSASRALPALAPVDLTLAVALVFVIVLALI